MSHKQRKTVIFLVLSICIAAIILFIGNRHFNSKKEAVLSNLKTDESKYEKVETSFPDNEIYIYYLKGKIDIFVKGSNKESDNYVGYRIQRSQKELKRDVKSSNYDVWNLNGAYEYRRHSEDGFRNLAKIVKEGEWELALKEKGASDFVGGSLHGDEITTGATLYIDGEETELGGLIKERAKEISFVTSSDLYRDNTMTEKLEKIAEHNVEYTFNSNGLTVDHEVKFLEHLSLEKSYLAMIPILRKSNEDSGNQITDTLVINDDKYDVSESGFTIPGLNNRESSNAKIFSEDSGISASIEIFKKEPSLPTSFLISNSKYYNKIYFAFNPNEYQASKGEIWKQTTHYKIDTSN